MNRNVGRIDAVSRVVAGVALVGLALLATLNVVTVPIGSALGVGVIALVLIVEGATRRCLLYRVLGIDRCPVD